jgi:PKD repeat protein
MTSRPLPESLSPPLQVVQDVLPLVETTPPALPNIPDLDVIATSKASSDADDDRYRVGSDFATGLASSRVAISATQLDFTPAWAGSNRQTDDAAYALYELQAGALSGEQTLSLSWNDEPKNYSNLFVALSSFSTGRWVWAQGSASPIALADVADYRTTDGRLFVAVLLLGNQPAQLAWLKLGGNLAPTAVLTSPASIGTVPLQLTLDASGSFDRDGTIVSYDFDLNNDGVFEHLAQPAVSTFTINSPPGSYTCAVKVTDNSGQINVATLNYTVLAGGGPPQAKLLVDYVFANAPYTANLDASSSIVPNGVAKFEWDLNGDGTYETDTGLTPTAQANIGSGPTVVRVRITDNSALSDTDSVDCFGSSPGYDEVENNDSSATGNIIAALGIRDFEGNLGDTGAYDGDLEDFYRVIISEPIAVQFNMLFLHANADLDMRLLDTDGTTQLAASNSVSDNEQITYNFSTPGTYVIRCLRFGTVPSSADYTLDFRRLRAPVVSLSADVSTGDAPLTVNFSANATDPDGIIASYAWDFNGDGTFEFNSGTTPTTSHSYTSGGTRLAAVRVTDNDGVSSIAQIEITTFVNYDEVENNDSPAQAQPLPAADLDVFLGNIGAGGPLDGDVEDWYKFNASAGVQIACILTFDSSASELDLSLYDTDGTTLLMTSAGVDDDEFVMLVPAANGTYYLRIFYKTSTTKLSPTDYIISLYNFELNEVEPNESPDQGNMLPTIPFSKFGGNMGVNSGSQQPFDWYRLNVATAGTHTIWLRFIDDFCDIDCRLYDTDGTTVIGSSTNTDNDERIAYSFPTPGTYFLQVYNFALGPADYLIQVR